MDESQTLTRYEAARFALAEARRVDEVKDIRNKAAAMQEYARQAKDTAMLRDATEIRLRAEHRAGELLAAMTKHEGGRPEKTGHRTRPVSEPPATLASLGITKTESSKWQKLAALPDDKFEIRVAHAKARVEGMTTSAPSYANAEYAGEDDEWFTPSDIIELAREALGGIDLDPASHPIAQQTIRAAAFYTAGDNGLDRPWFGRVWLNPPFNRTLLSLFVEKLLAEYASGAVEQAILLTHDYTDVEWFHAAARAAQAVCFPRGRIHFLSPCGDECSPRQGQALFYFGREDAAFRRTFTDVGLIVSGAAPPSLETAGAMTWPQRIDNFRRAFKREPFLTYVAGERPWLYGVWLQNDYAVRSGYYGGYPGDYLKRIRALFPDARRTLHVFSGKVDLAAMPGDTLDIRADLAPTFCADAQIMQGVALGSYDLALADPPYTKADAAQYGAAMPTAGRVMRALEGLPAGARVVWLDQRVPRSDKTAFVHEGVIGLSTSAGHRFRVISIFRRIGQ